MRTSPDHTDERYGEPRRDRRYRQNTYAGGNVCDLVEGASDRDDLMAAGGRNPQLYGDAVAAVTAEARELGAHAPRIFHRAAVRAS